MYQLRNKKYDIVIKNGILIDTIGGFEKKEDIAVVAGKIVAIGTVSADDAKMCVDAEGCYVSAGLIDYHCHVFHGGDWASCPAEVYALPNGVTTLVDAGSAGCGGFPMFWNGVAARSLVNVKAYIFVGTGGQVGLGCVEDENPAHINRDGIVELCQKYPKEIVGIKIKIDKDHLAQYGIEPLREAIRLGEQTGLRVSAHATDPVVPVDELIDLFRPGDIYCHMYHETGEGILDESGRVRDSIRRARERGVLFDAAHGKTNNFSLSCAKKAIDQGFTPDIISSDYTKISLSARYPFTMMLSEYLNLGMSFTEVLRCCTENPAKLIADRNTPFLAPGEAADLAVLKITERPVTFWDHYGNLVHGDRLIENKMTICNGEILFDQLEDKYQKFA